MHPTGTERSAPARRARSALLCAGLAMLVLQGGLRLFIEYGDPGVRDPGYAVHLAQLRQGGAGPDGPLRVLMLGSSRTMLGLKAAEMGDALTRRLGRPVLVHNYGEPGNNPLNHLFRWRRLRQDGLHIDLLLVEVMPSQLNANRPVNQFVASLLFPVNRLRAADLPLLEHYTGESAPNLRRDWYLAYCFPWYAHREELLRRSARFFVPLDRRFLPTEEANACGDPLMSAADKMKMRTPRALSKTYEEYAFWFEEFRLGGSNCQALHELLEDARAQSVPVALVLMPEGPTFRSWFPESMYRQVYDWLTGLSREHACALINAHEWLDEDDFFDSHHMLGPGAEKFTRRLEREAVLPLLESRYGLKVAPEVAEATPR
jgi:hypothetical protein